MFVTTLLLQAGLNQIILLFLCFLLVLFLLLFSLLSLLFLLLSLYKSLFYSLTCRARFGNLLWCCSIFPYWRISSTVNCLLNLANVWLYLVGGLKKHFFVTEVIIRPFVWSKWSFDWAKVASRKSNSIKFVLISILKPKFRNTWTMFIR